MARNVLALDSYKNGHSTHLYLCLTALLVPIDILVAPSDMGVPLVWCVAFYGWCSVDLVTLGICLVACGRLGYLLGVIG